jgi:hypothetical protein
MHGTAMAKQRVALRDRTVPSEIGFFIVCLLKVLVPYKELRKMTRQINEHRCSYENGSAGRTITGMNVQNVVLRIIVLSLMSLA